MKSYTNLEQSRKLAEFLPIESADMWWPYYYDVISDTGEYDKEPMLHKPICDPDKAIPCWSLAALLDALPGGCFNEMHRLSLINSNPNEDAEWLCCYEDYEGNMVFECYAGNQVDACVEMIYKLKKKGLLQYEILY